MKNPIKFIQEVKQEAFKVTWPTWKETLQGALMVFAMAVVMSLFFLLLDQVLKFFLEIEGNLPKALAKASCAAFLVKAKYPIFAGSTPCSTSFAKSSSKR